MSTDVEPDSLAGLVRAGGNPFILITLVDHATGRVELVTAGFTPEQVVVGLREAADQLADQLIEASTTPADFDHLPEVDDQDLRKALERARQL